MSYGSMRKCVVITAAVVSCMSLATKARAADYNFTISDQYFMGVVSPDGGDPTTEATEITQLSTMAPNTINTIDYGTPIGSQDFTRSGNTLCYTGCPGAGDVISSNDTGGTANFGTLDGTQTYIKAKYDHDKAGMYVWYVAGLTGTFTVPLFEGTCGNSGCGLSHWIVFGGTGGGTGNPETGGGTGNPETGPEPASLLLFGAALGIAGLRMRRRVRVQ
jgi:hypothetical protein